jgi:hypothetical protein
MDVQAGPLKGTPKNFSIYLFYLPFYLVIERTERTKRTKRTLEEQKIN